MGTKLFVSLPVKDLDRATVFYRELGFTFNPQFSDETAACTVISRELRDAASEKKFREFTPKAIVDTVKSAQVLLAISTELSEAVAEMCKKAFADGGKKYTEPQNHDFMYGWGFEDRDGHTSEPFWMDPETVQPDQET